MLTSILSVTGWFAGLFVSSSATSTSTQSVGFGVWT